MYLSKGMEKQQLLRLPLSSPLLPIGVRKQAQDMVVQRSHLLRHCQLLL